MCFKNTRLLNTNILIFLLLLNTIPSESSSQKSKYEEAEPLAKTTFYASTKMFLDCSESVMPTLHFEIDDIKRYVNYPSKTTVGFAPKFTSNRKFFANLISTTAFKEMLQKDRDKLAKSNLAKMKYCESVMDRNLLNDFYDREVDQIKMDTIPENDKYYIETNDGPIYGIIEKYARRQYYKFKSIPYAKPPLGRLRFLPPSPIERWTEVKDCTQDAPIPPSSDADGNVIGSEDCLYIEVSTSNIHPNKSLPVMFWTGCYGFSYVTDHWYDTKLLVDHNVVFVRCGFRLGPFGFLSINDICAPGNCGLKDIVMALKWVQRNIKAFGGDPNNVTLFGNSSGGAIIDFMMLSPMAAGLFHKAIIQSASALNNWSLDKNPSQSVKKLAALLGIEKKICDMEIIDELHSIPAEDIIIAFEKMRKIAIDKDITNFLDSPFKPCIEIEFEGQPSFLSKLPSTILKSGNFAQVPILIGSTNTEGNLLQYVQQDFYEDLDKFKKTVSLLVHKTLTGDMTNKQTTEDVVQEILKFYLGEEDQLTEHTKSQFKQLISDYFFIYFVNKTVRLHKQYAPASPLYYYVINYAGEWCLPSCCGFINSMGHNAELPLLFELKMPDQPSVIKGGRDSVKTRSRVQKMWTNFAKHGNPTPDEDTLLQIKWDPVESVNKLNFLNIGTELTKGINPFQERMAFWDKIYLKNSITRTFVYFSDIGIDWQ